MKYTIKQRVTTPAGPGIVITLPPNGSGSQMYIVLLDNSLGILCDAKQMQPLEKA